MNDLTITTTEPDYSLVLESICAAADIGSNKLAELIESFDNAITVAQLAKILSCSKQQVYKLVDDGKLPALKIGTLVRLDPGTVGAWIRRRMTVQ